MLIHFAVALVLITIIDFIWLGVLMSSFYIREIGDLGRLVNGKFEPLLAPAAVVYILLAFGVAYFVLKAPPENWAGVFVKGALLGLTIYGVYDMTNMATLARWPLKMALVDMAWGSFLCGSVAVITQYIGGKLT